MATSKCIVGACLKMCPDREIKFRERNNLLHYLEIDHTKKRNLVADPKKVVKEFSRSAAGKANLSSSDLRPSHILLKTVNYLINEVIPTDELPYLSVYDFVNDRLQAVRQDITIQMIEDGNSVEIFEKCVRFYITASYILCEEPQMKFDQHLNSQQLLICLEKVFVLYKKFKSEHIHEFIGIYLSQNVIHSEIYYRSVSIFSSYIFEENVKFATQVCIAYINRNFIRFFKLVKELPLILLLSFFHYFPKVREDALKILNAAFSSNACRFPSDVLCSWINVPKDDFLMHLCQICGIKIENKNVCFNKKTFNTTSTSSCPKMRKEEFVDFKLSKVSLSEIINGFS